MSALNPARAASDHNLLFGILALQMDFITRDQLVAGMHAWVLNKTSSLGDILVGQKALAGERRLLLEALVQEHLKQHGNDAEKSLQALSSLGPAKEQLQRIADSDVQGSLIHVAAPPGPADPYMTAIPPSLGTINAGGARFRILRPHARGGLGEVYVARDEELGREVALKEIQERYAGSSDSRSRFVLEAEVTGGLEHPGIVPVYGLGQYADGRPFYAMRFIRGDSLKDVIERFHRAETGPRDPGARNLELRQLLGRFVDVCHAIAYAHHRGVLHRDLKPGNIMLGQYGETLVVDWGLAKTLGRAESAAVNLAAAEGPLLTSSMSGSAPTQMGSTLGTPGYMSPEQASGRLDLLGPASDVYSLGATLYCLLTGRAPFTDASDMGELLRRVERGEFPRPRQAKPDVPLPLEAICLKAMAMRPEDRYGGARLLAADIEHWMADEPTSAWAEPWTVRAGRWLRRHRSWAVSAAAAVLATAMILAVATVMLKTANERERLAKEDALRQQALAEANFRLARQAVDRYHTEVSEEILLREPGLEPLRKKLLEAAREFYAQFVQQRGDDPQLKGELGRALFRLGQIAGDLDGEAKGIESHQRARAIFLALGPEYRADLARSYHHLGRLHRLAEQNTSAEEEYGKARELWTTLVKEDKKYEPDLARTHLGLGNVYQTLRRLDLARAEYEKAITTLTRLVQANPDDLALQRDLAVVHGNLATALLSLGGEKRQARAAAETALALQDKLVRLKPMLSQYRNDLARTHFFLGVYYTEFAETRDSDKARAEHAKAVSHWEILAARHPEVGAFRASLAHAYLALAGLSQGPAALQVCQKGLTLQQELADKNKEVAHFHRDLALGQLQLGTLYQAAREFERAAAAYGAALTTLKGLPAPGPAAPHYQADFARVYRHLGQLYFEQERLEPAAESASAAVDRLLELHRRHPEAAPQIQELAQAYALRAKIRARQTRYAEALPDWNQAIAQAGSSERLWYRLYRSETLVRSGDLEQGLKEAEALAPAAPRSGPALYQLARIYALAATAEARPASRDTYATRARELLTAAQAVAYFQSAAQREKLKTDPELRYLRERDDFRAWFHELATGATAP
jgi:eukaryotic-like serine/threonine-protein kinase